MGHGLKFDFTKSAVISPGPAVFNKQSEFDKEKNLKKGKIFGLSRDKMKECGYIT